jgi:phosphoglycolate phosphatase
MAAVLRGVKAAIIDLDGTMLHTMPDFEVAINNMRAELGLGPVTEAQIELMVGKGSEKPACARCRHPACAWPA